MIKKQIKSLKGFQTKLFAFTLAEVLITLGIIGVVAAMTIPTLISKIGKRQLESQIKASYATIAQTMRAAQADDVGFDMPIKDGDTSKMKEWFETYMSPYLKVEKICYNTPGCWHKKGTSKDLKGNLTPWDNNNGIGTNIVTFIIAKGAYFDIDSYGTASMNVYFGINTNGSDGLIFYFDANGDRKPNQIGKDIYIMAFTDKGLVPAGSDKTKQEVEQNCLNGNGYWCLSYLIQNGWQIPDAVWKR